MFMLSTIIFLICYIPKVVIILLEARNPRFWEEFSDSGRAGILFVYRMYIINNITNPIIFAFLDSQFRGEFKKLFKNCCWVNVSFVIWDNHPSNLHGQLIKMLYMYIQCFLLNKHNYIITETNSSYLIYHILIIKKKKDEQHDVENQSRKG